VRYGIGSGLAALTSAVVFALVLDHGPRLATASASVAGFLINFSANRFWAWNRRARRGLGRDMLSYGALAVAAGVAAAVVTSVTHALLRDADPDRRAVLVEASYFATYGLLFVVKFLVLDRVIFRSRHQVPSTTRA